MLNSVSAGPLYGIPHPLQAPIDLQRVATEIVTQDLEQVHVRSAAPIDEQGEGPATKNADARERGIIIKLSSRAPLETSTSERVYSVRAKPRVNGHLVNVYG